MAYLSMVVLHAPANFAAEESQIPFVPGYPQKKWAPRVGAGFYSGQNGRSRGLCHLGEMGWGKESCEVEVELGDGDGTSGALRAGVWTC